jgi:predicted RNase H-like nuclease (RuvC/YqgF family)
MLKSMGGATAASVDAQNQKIDANAAAAQDQNAKLEAEIKDLKAGVDSLSARMDDIQKTAQDVARIDALVTDLQGKIDQLPQATLQRLIDVLNKAQAELQQEQAQQPSP